MSSRLPVSSRDPHVFDDTSPDGTPSVTSDGTSDGTPGTPDTLADIPVTFDGTPSDTPDIPVTFDGTPSDTPDIPVTSYTDCDYPDWCNNENLTCHITNFLPGSILKGSKKGYKGKCVPYSMYEKEAKTNPDIKEIILNGQKIFGHKHTIKNLMQTLRLNFPESFIEAAKIFINKSYSSINIDDFLDFLVPVQDKIINMSLELKDIRTLHRSLYIDLSDIYEDLYLKWIKPDEPEEPEEPEEPATLPIKEPATLPIKKPATLPIKKSATLPIKESATPPPIKEPATPLTTPPTTPALPKPHPAKAKAPPAKAKAPPPAKTTPKPDEGTPIIEETPVAKKGKKGKKVEDIETILEEVTEEPVTSIGSISKSRQAVLKCLGLISSEQKK